MQQLFFAVSNVAEYLRAVEAYKDIKGFLAPMEGYTLFAMAAYGPGQGAIVEIGSLYGLSTCWLARGAKLANREKVTAIDHFKGSPEHKEGEAFELPDLKDAGTTFFTFMQNIRQAGLDKMVCPVASSSTEAAAAWSGPVRLLFVDGEHTYDAVKSDFNAWSRFIVSEGLVVFHDILWQGVQQFYEELLQSGEWRESVRLENMGAVQRVQG